MSQLPLTVLQRSGEPAHGLLMRLGARNGYSSPRRFARSLGLDFRSVLTGASVASLAQAAGFSESVVASSSPIIRMPERRATLCNEVIAVGDWSTGSRRYCPVCFSADVEQARTLRLQPSWYAAHQTQWDVRSIQTCSRHGIELRSICHRCDNRLGWSSTDMLHCANCTADLTAAPCSSRDDQFGNYLSDRLAGQARPNPVLATLPLHHVVDLCERLGQIRLVGAMPTLPRQSPSSLIEARERGFRMTFRLEGDVTRDLDKVFQRCSVPDGLLGAYGWIYCEWLVLDEPITKAVRPILFEHAARNGIASPNEPRLGNSPPITISMTGTARALGMSYERARGAAAAAGIIPSGSRRGVAFTIDPDAVDMLKVPQKLGLSPRVAASELRTGKAQVGDFLSAGLLELTADARVSAASVQGLRAQLSSKCCQNAPPEGLIPMAQAARNSSVPLAQICAAISNELIPCWEVDRPGLSAFLVRPIDIANLRIPTARITIETAAKRLGVHPQCARALARCGTLADGDLKISETGLATFKRRYVVGVELARQAGRSPKRHSEILRSLGVAPAFDLQTHRQAIYRRDDLPSQRTMQ